MKWRFIAIFSLFILFLTGTITFAQDADSLRIQGDEAYKAKDFDKAIELYRASLKINGKNWQVHEALGNAYFKAKRYTDAAASYAEALGYNPQLLSAYYNIGYSYMKAGLFNEAIKYLEKYVSLKGDDPDGFYRLAESYYSVAEKDNAIKNYEKFLSMANKDVSQKKIDDAKAKLAELKGSSGGAPAVAVVPSGMTPQQQTNPSSPAQTPSVVPSATPVVPPVTVSPAVPKPTPSPVTSESKTMAPVTQQPAQQSVPAAGSDTMMKSSLANDPAIEIIKEADGHLANGNYRLAISTYRDALIKNPNSIQAHYNLGIALAKVERYEQAIAEWEKVLQLDPSNSGAQENINRAKAKLSGASSTVSPSASVTQARPSQQSTEQPQTQVSPVDDLLAKANKANSAGDYASAIKYIDELMVIKKDVADAYVVKGDALLGMAKYLDAINEYKKALALNPQLANPLFGMAESYRLLAKTDMAIQYYKLFLNSPAPDKAKWRIERASKMLKSLEAIR
ncbi:MAG: tetratricopeptide repeat protein [Deltaproteobacteria bacterium]|nr:tetratricopeptide repeat protein [Deltaproteobacteria bacterium]